jgi:hypothetical protein
MLLPLSDLFEFEAVIIVQLTRDIQNWVQFHLFSHSSIKPSTHSTIITEKEGFYLHISLFDKFKPIFLASSWKSSGCG